MRFVVVGSGFGEVHLQWLTECAGTSVQALCYHSDEARARELAARFDVPEVSNDPAAVIAAGGVDGLAVVSPPETHEALTEPGLAAGLLVVTDKPLAATVDGARRLAERAAGARTAVTFQWRINPAFRALRDLLAAEAVGPVVHVDLTFHHDFLAGPETNWPWRHEAATAAAGTLGDQGVHLFDLLRWLVPGDWAVQSGSGTVVYPRRVFQGREIPAETDDVAEVRLEHPERPAAARVYTSRVSAGLHQVRVSVQGATGVATVEASPDDGSAVLSVYSAAGPTQITEFPAHSMNIYEALLGDAAADVADFADGYAAQLVLAEAMDRGVAKPRFLA